MNRRQLEKSVSLVEKDLKGFTRFHSRGKISLRLRRYDGLTNKSFDRHITSKDLSWNSKEDHERLNKIIVKAILKTKWKTNCIDSMEKIFIYLYKELRYKDNPLINKQLEDLIVPTNTGRKRTVPALDFIQSIGKEVNKDSKKSLEVLPSAKEMDQTLIQHYNTLVLSELKSISNSLEKLTLLQQRIIQLNS
tara:strand:- start:258 stop:833 length:576 start_codon:yes stop_codon:yes gene_type:complete